jgi:hypothetical protein
MEQKPSDITAELDKFLAPYLFPDRDDGSDPRLCPKCGNGKLALRGGRFGAFVACSNYPECKFTRKFAQPGGADGMTSDGPEVLGKHPETGRGDQPEVGTLWPLCRNGRGQGGGARLDPQGYPFGRFRPRLGRPAVVAAAHHRLAPGKRRAGDRQHRPLWPLSGASGQICPPAVDRRRLRNRDERRCRQARRGGQRQWPCAQWRFARTV